MTIGGKVKVLCILIGLLCLSLRAFAADPAPACLDQDIKIQQLTRQVATQAQQLLCGPQCLQQFANAGQAAETAAAEEKRLQALKSKPALPEKPAEATAPTAASPPVTDPAAAPPAETPSPTPELK